MIAKQCHSANHRWYGIHGDSPPKNSPKNYEGDAFFDYPNKYYCEDVGLRNARVGFRQHEITRLTENVIFNELKLRGYEVDVGVVYSREKKNDGKYGQIPREIDFVIKASTANSSKFVGVERHLIPLTGDLWYNFRCANCGFVSLESKRGRGERIYNRLKKGKRR